jgi:hypothetical protein
MATPVTWSPPAWLSLGWILALIVAILAVLLFALGRLPMEWALLTVAVCSHRL